MSGTEKRPPEKLKAEHDVSAFDCGEPVLDEWLVKWALRNQESGASRTYVVSEENRVVAYYSLAAGSIARASVSGRISRNMPEPVPVAILARLAVARAFQGQGLGRSLLRDAVLRTMQAADIIGVRAILVHALSERAKRFYEDCGFVSSPVQPLTLMITIAQAINELRRSNPGA